MTASDFRRIALTMEGAIESAHMHHPDFRANGKIFATLSPDGTQGMVKLTPDVQQEYLRAHPAVFEPASGAWGRQGCTMVNLAKADSAIVRAAMTHACRDVHRAKPRPRATRTASAKKTSRS